MYKKGLECQSILCSVLDGTISIKMGNFSGYINK